MRHALHRCRTGADDGNPLVREFVQGGAEGIAAGVVVVPAARVETMAWERLNARDARKFRDVERPGAHRNELGGEEIAPVRPDYPTRRWLLPLQIRDLCVEEGVVVEAVLL